MRYRRKPIVSLLLPLACDNCRTFLYDDARAVSSCDTVTAHTQHQTTRKGGERLAVRLVTPLERYPLGDFTGGALGDRDRAEQQPQHLPFR